MSIFKIIGHLIAGLGLLCGVFLLLSPLSAVAAYGLLLTGKTFAMVLLFVVLSAVGLVLAGMGGGSKAAIDRLLFQLGCAWLILGVLAIFALVLSLIGVINAEITLIWWLMAAGCSVVGTVAVVMGSGSRATPAE